MISRGTIIAALLVAELAIIGEAVAAVRAGLPSPWFDEHSDARTASGPRLIESGPHRLFDVGSHPALTVDIGHADLTIRAGASSQIDVGLAASTGTWFFSAKAPITASQDGEAIRIDTADAGKWKGDNRMVTVVVPPQTQVTVVDAGDIRASGLRADASFKSVGEGTITVDDFDAPALRVASSDGRILLQQVVATRLDATSSDGHVEASALNVRDGSIESDGHVTLGFAAGADTLVNAETSDGKVNVSGFAAASPFEPKRRSRDDDDNDSSAQTVRVGAGEGHLNVHSSDGNINLEQEG